MALLREAVERQKNAYIELLIQSGFTKLTDGRQLYELTLTELIVLHKKYSVNENRKQDDR